MNKLSTFYLIMYSENMIKMIEAMKQAKVQLNICDASKNIDLKLITQTFATNINTQLSDERVRIAEEQQIRKHLS